MGPSEGGEEALVTHPLYDDYIHKWYICTTESGHYCPISRNTEHISL